MDPKMSSGEDNIEGIIWCVKQPIMHRHWSSTDSIDASTSLLWQCGAYRIFFETLMVSTTAGVPLITRNHKLAIQQARKEGKVTFGRIKAPHQLAAATQRLSRQWTWELSTSTSWITTSWSTLHGVPCWMAGIFKVQYLYALPNAIADEWDSVYCIMKDHVCTSWNRPDIISFAFISFHMVSLIHFLRQFRHHLYNSWDILPVQHSYVVCISGSWSLRHSVCPHLQFYALTWMRMTTLQCRGCNLGGRLSTKVEMPHNMQDDT